MDAQHQTAWRKAEVRAEKLRARAAVTPAARAAAGVRIARAVRALPELAGPTGVLAYAATPTEAPTAELVAALLAAGHAVAVPVLNPGDGGGRGMRGQRLGPGGLTGLRPGPRGVLAPEPADPDDPDAWLDTLAAVLVPGVAFDPRTGARLGRGGGFYDAYLEAHPEALAIGVALEAQLAEGLPVEAHDRPVSVLVTEARTIRF